MKKVYEARLGMIVNRKGLPSINVKPSVWVLWTNKDGLKNSMPVAFCQSELWAEVVAASMNRSRLSVDHLLSAHTAKPLTLKKAVRDRRP